MTEVERVRASSLLGRTTQLQRLFEFLVACQATGRVPKEVEVAVDCFDRGVDVDLTQDATVRVTAHKLRRRLEEFYRDGAGGAPMRLTIPRGEYRLALEAPIPDATPGRAAAGWRRFLPHTARERAAAGVIGLLLVLAVALAMLVLRVPHVPADTAAVRDSALWAPLLHDDLPVQLVLGDYYIFGERDERGVIARLVRDFDVNSRQDLEHGFIRDPARAARFADLNLGYLPTSSAQALREVLPVLMASGKQVTLTLASELDPSTIKTTHIVYVGYLSALGMLQEMVLSGSRYSFGGSYDELIDSMSGNTYVSEAGEPHAAAERYRDYAYLASFRGPGGVQHLIVAGTRDTGLMQAAEIAAGRPAIEALATRKPVWKGFEALYEVQSVNGMNVESRLLEASAFGP
jgi:hypothetical protein